MQGAEGMLAVIQHSLIAFAVGLCCMVACIGSLDMLSALYTAYERERVQLEDEAWLLTNCRDPVFFSKMRSYSNICFEVEAHARVGPAWSSLRSVSESFRASFQPMLVRALFACAGVLLMLPSCCALVFPRRTRRWMGGGRGGMLVLHPNSCRAEGDGLKEGRFCP